MVDRREVFLAGPGEPIIVADEAEDRDRRRRERVRVEEDARIDAMISDIDHGRFLQSMTPPLSRDELDAALKVAERRRMADALDDARLAGDFAELTQWADSPEMVAHVEERRCEREKPPPRHSEYENRRQIAELTRRQAALRCGVCPMCIAGEPCRV